MALSLGMRLRCMMLGVVLIEWVYVVDMSGELPDEFCVRKTKSLTHRIKLIQS